MRRILLVLLTVALGIGCNESDATDSESDAGALFSIRACRDAEREGELFRVRILDPAVIAEAESLVGATETRIVVGSVLRGDGGFNSPWSWHLDPDSIEFADSTIELCDGCPQYLEDHLDAWLGEVGRYCPWSTEVVERMR